MYISLQTALVLQRSSVSVAPGNICPVAVISDEVVMAPELMVPVVIFPKSAVTSTTLVPSEYKILKPLSVPDHVAPVPEVVLNVTVWSPVVAFQLNKFFLLNLE